MTNNGFLHAYEFCRQKGQGLFSPGGSPNLAVRSLTHNNGKKNQETKTDNGVFPNTVIKIFLITVKGLEPVTSCIRDQDATTWPARHKLETGSLN